MGPLGPSAPGPIHPIRRISSIKAMPSAIQIVQLTPAGRSAIATCLVRGTGAVRFVAPLLALSNGRRLDALWADRIAVGQWRGTQPEEVVVTCRGTDEVTLHCHGGPMAIATILGDLAAAGAQTLDWQRWLEHPGNHLAPADPLAAEAVIALSQARTERCAAILLDQFHGALRRELLELLALIQRGETGSATQRIANLLSHSGLGTHLDRPWHVAICGPPNVGKSSLINALLGYGRAIVAPQPGTTRDVVSAATAIDGWPIELSDTAGLRAAADELESAGIALGKRHVARADLRMLLLDRSAPFGPAEQGLAAALPDAMIVYNKCDLAPHNDVRQAAIEVSALTGLGIDTLSAAISSRLVPLAPPPGSAVPFRTRHIDVLTAASESLSQEDVLAATDHLKKLLIPDP